MHALTWLAMTTPTPSPSPTIDPDRVTPGVAGFIGIAVIAIAVVFLLIDMQRRIRRARYRSEIAEQLDTEQQARTERPASDPAGPDGIRGHESPGLTPPGPEKD
jgi:hypothetical protein